MLVSYHNVLFAAAIGILPVTWWLWVIVKRNHFGKESFNLLIKVFFWGVLTAIPASALEIIISETGGGNEIVLWMQKFWLFGETPFDLVALLSAGLIATIEELSKLIGILVVLMGNKIKSINDGLIVGLVVGLAFAVTENGVYFSVIAQSGEIIDFGSVIPLRFVLSTSAHVIYSSVAGLFLAKAMLTKGYNRFYFSLLTICLPITIHAIFNFLLGGPRGANSAIMALILGIGLLILWNEYQENRGNFSPKIKRRK